MSRWRRSPRQFDLVVEQVREQLAPQTLLGEVQRVWSEVVGAAIAANAQPTAERAGLLTISCSASVWAQELDLMAPTIVKRLNRTLGSGRIVRLRCVATPAVG